MKAYDRDLWGISLREYNRLRDAVEQGAILPWIADSKIYELKNHLITVDEIINLYKTRTPLVSDYNRMRNSISQGEFQQIVNDVLREEPDVLDYRFFNMGVTITVRSRSGKERWGFDLYFDDGGCITGNYKHYGGYPGASLPWTIGNKIMRYIKSALYE